MLKFTRWLFVLALLAAVSLGSLGMTKVNPVQAESGGGGTLDFELSLPGYQLQTDERGVTRVLVEGFSQGGLTGEAVTPEELVAVALPPDADPASLWLEVLAEDTQALDGTYLLPAGQPPMPGDEHPLPAAQGPQPLPAQTRAAVEVVHSGALRSYSYVQVRFAPVRYDAAGGITLITRMVVRLHYDASLTAQAARISDPAGEQMARENFLNGDEAVAWYGDGLAQPQAVYNYVIITTNAIRSASSQLNNFVAHKQAMGFSVLVVTEDDYGSLTGPQPNGRAEKIRKWLQNNYLTYSIQYVLLVGNPDPDDPTSTSDSVGDVPMKMLWPYCTTSSNDDYYCVSPSDYYYADLTGNWNPDGDSYYGELSDYNATGGVDLANEVVVGRIPYYGTISALDSILAKTIAYETSGASAGWRASALLPMSFSDAQTDGAELGEDMKSGYLNSAGFSSWTMYQQGSGCNSSNSTYSSNQELVGGTDVRDRWAANDYGLVLWWGHGSETGAYVGFGSCFYTLFSSSQTSVLDNSHPSFVYQNSCLNGYPENSDNLGYALLRNGAISTVSASRVSWYSPGESNFVGSGTNAGVGYEYARQLVAVKKDGGSALFDTKRTRNLWGFGEFLMNLYDFNLYGDPAVGLLSTVECYTLNKTASPGGSGTVDAAPAPNCGSRYLQGTVVTLSQTAAAGYAFREWSGDASGTAASVQVTMDANRTVTANYDEICYTLTTNVSPADGGQVAVSPAGNCTTGSGYKQGTTVNLTASPINGYIFGQWSGDLSSSNAGASLVMNAARTVTANFTQPAPAISAVKPAAVTVGMEAFTLTVSGSGFTTHSVVRWNGGDLATSFVSSTSLTAAVPAGSISDATPKQVTVFNPAPGGGLSAAVSLPVRAVQPYDGQVLKNLRPTFNWEDVPGATKYAIQIGYNAKFTSLVLSTTSPVSEYAMRRDLPRGRTLYWRVRPVLGTVNGSWDLNWSLVTPYAPYPVALVTPINGALVTNPTPRFDWKNVVLPKGTAFDHYQLQLATENTFGAPVVDQVVAAGQTVSEYTLTAGQALLPNTRYYWRVRAVNTNGDTGSWSSVRYLRSAMLPPVLIAPDAGALDVALRPAFTWNGVDSATGYTLQVSAYADFRSLIISKALTGVTGYTPGVNLPRGKVLYWRVRTRGVNGPSLWSGVWSFTTQQ